MFDKKKMIIRCFCLCFFAGGGGGGEGVFLMSTSLYYELLLILTKTSCPEDIEFMRFEYISLHPVKFCMQIFLLDPDHA